MATLIDSSLWIDFTRAKSPQPLKQFIAPYVLAPDATIAQPVVFEVMRYATPKELPLLEQQFKLLPQLSTPGDLWHDAAALGRTCRTQGVAAGAMDLLIATVAIHHSAELVTFDQDFQAIASISALRVLLLVRPP